MFGNVKSPLSSRAPTLIRHCEEHSLLRHCERHSDVAIPMRLNTRRRTAVAAGTSGVDKGVVISNLIAWRASHGDIPRDTGD